MTVAKESEGVLVSDFTLPFIVEHDTEENTPNVSVDIHDHAEDTPLVEVVDWTVSNIDKESETCVLSCSLSIDTDKLYRMKELPVVEIEVKTKDGLNTHKHALKLEHGELNDGFPFIIRDIYY